MVTPMFPLGTVLFPGMRLPLHIFEARYREMVEVCLAGTPEFGVVLIERGNEVGGGDTRFDVGCIARIVGAAHLDDGRWVLETVGTRRVRVNRWLSDRPYPRADVDDWDEPSRDPAAERHRAATETRLRRVLALAAEMGESVAESTLVIDDEPGLASYQMASRAPLGPLDRQCLLEAATSTHRLEILGRLLDEQEAVLARRLAGG